MLDYGLQGHYLPLHSPTSRRFVKSAFESWFFRLTILRTMYCSSAAYVRPQQVQLSAQSLRYLCLWHFATSWLSHRYCPRHGHLPLPPALVPLCGMGICCGCACIGAPCGNACPPAPTHHHEAVLSAGAQPDPASLVSAIISFGIKNLSVFAQVKAVDPLSEQFISICIRICALAQNAIISGRSCCLLNSLLPLDRCSSR